MVMSNELHREPWIPLEEILGNGDTEALRAYLAALPPGETARAISRLRPESRVRLFSLLAPSEAAALVEELSDAQAAALLGELAPERAAAIVDRLPSDERVDVLGQLGPDGAEAILRRMGSTQAESVRRLRRHAVDTAGGLMITEYLAYDERCRVADVVDDLRRHSGKYANYDVQYAYVTAADGRLIGVVRLRDLLLAPAQMPVTGVMIADPRRVKTDTHLDDLRRLFDRFPFYGVPVTDEENRLVGVVRRSDVEEAVGEQADRTFLKFSGIAGGEELRTMPLMARSLRRLGWLSINIVLNVMAAAVIAFYQDTVAAVVALAVFLPIISDMSGCSGNQAVAVSLRELTLGLVRPYEVLRVLAKEVGVGVVNGIVLGGLLAGVALAWQGNPYLGLVVGGALAANTVVAVAIGGAVPLILRRLGYDPALASGPILTTVTDTSGFFLVLSLATASLPLLGGA
jgi:magnesium transporter